MALTRPEKSRRKRKTDTVDILNSISNKKTNTTDDRLTQSARPSRRIQNRPIAPRRNIWDIPDSPELPRAPLTNSSPLADARAQSPRRTIRHSPFTEKQRSFVRSSPRKTRAPVRYQEEYAEQESSLGTSREEGDNRSAKDSESSNGAEEDSSSDKSREEGDKRSMEDNESSHGSDAEEKVSIGSVRFFSGDDDRYPSPSAFQLEQALEQSGQFDSAQSTPHKSISPQTITPSRVRNKSGQFASTQLKRQKLDQRKSTASQQTPNTRARNKSGQFIATQSQANGAETSQWLSNSRARDTQPAQDAPRSQNSGRRGKVQSPAVVVNNGPNKGPETHFSEQHGTQHSSGSLQPDDGEDGMEIDSNEHVPINVDGNDSEVNFDNLESASASSSSSLFVREDRAAELSKPLRRSTRSKISRQPTESRKLRPRKPAGASTMHEIPVDRDFLRTQRSDAGSDSLDSVPASSSSNMFIRQDGPSESFRPPRQSKKPQQPTKPHNLRPKKSADPGTMHDSPMHRESVENENFGITQSPSQSSLPESHLPADERRESRSRLFSNAVNRQPTRGALASRRIRGRNSRLVYNIPAREGREEESPQQESNYPRCQDAMEIGQQQRNWKTLIDEARRIRKSARSHAKDGSMEEDFRYMTELIGDLQQRYETTDQDLERSSSTLAENAQECARTLDMIKCAGHQILDDVYKLVADYGDEIHGDELFEGMESHIIPALIQLVFAIFDRYHLNPGSPRFSYDHLHRTLVLLSELCKRMMSLVKERYVRTRTRCKFLQPPLQKLIEASNNGLLQRAASTTSEEVEVFEPDWKDPWTNTEGRALIDGLKQHLGPGRYHLIMQDFREELGRRTIRELKQKAQWSYDMLVPQLQEQISTPQGRDEMHWLLSVREQ